jgi:hypothetical protein
MHRNIYHRLAMGIATATTLACLSTSQLLADANEEGQVALVCYKWADTSEFANERLRMSVRKPAPITEIEPAQQTWGMTGRHVNVCGEGTASVVRGVIVADEAMGTARMAINSIAVRGHGERDLCRPVTWDCDAAEPVRTPSEWLCEGRNEFGEYLGDAKLEKMDNETIAADPACQFYEIGMSVSQSETATGTFGQ